METRAILGIVVVALAAGCATTSPDAAFSDVQKQVFTRTGQRVQWHRNEQDEAAFRQTVGDALRGDLTSETAVRVALINNHGIQAIYEDLGVGQAELAQAGLLKNPLLVGNIKFGLTGPGPEFEADLAQDFLQVFYIPLRKAVAESELEAAKLRVTGAVMSLVGQTRASFYRAQATQQTVEMLEQVVKATGASYDAMKRIHDAGNARDLDLTNERSVFEQTKLDLAAAMLERDTAREQLSSLMGLWGTDVAWKIADRLPELPKEPADLADLEQKAIANSLDLAAARVEIETYGRRVGVSKATALIPQLELGAAGKRETDGVWLLGPSFTLPIPLFDQGQARVAGAQAELRRRQQAYMQKAIEIRAAVRTVRARVLAARRIAEHYRDVMLPLRQRAVEQTQLQYNAMQVSVFNFLQVKQQQIDTGHRYIQALQTFWVAQTELDTLMQGRLVNLNSDTRTTPATAKAAAND